MTKAEALAEFRADVLPVVVRRYGRGDKVAIREAWNDYTDYLAKSRQITAKQYNEWDNPF